MRTAEAAAAALPGNGGDIVAGIGDDAAIVKFGNRLLLAAVDQLIGGIHYLQLATPRRSRGRNF